MTTSSSRTCPDFFVMYLPVLNRDRLRIPIDFVGHFNGFMPEKAILRDFFGRVWQVEVGEIGKSMFFLNGWQQFLMEKSVEEGDFLVFRYAGNSIFDFKLLGRTECEKEHTEDVDMDFYKKGFCVNEKDVEEAVEEEVEEEEGEKEEDEAEEEEVEDNEEEEEKSQPKSSNMQAAVLKHKYSTRGHPTIKRKNYYEAEEEEVEDDEEEEEEEEDESEEEEVEDDEEEEEKSQPKSPNMEAAVLKHKYSTRGHPTIKRKNYYEAEEEEVEDDEEDEEEEEDEAEEEEVEDDEEEEEKSQPKSPNMEVAVLKHKYSTRGNPTIKRKNYYEAEEEEVEDNEEEEEKSQPKPPNMEVALLKHKYSTKGHPTIKRKNYCGYKQSAVKRTRAVCEETALTKSKYRKAFSTQAMVDGALSIERNFESKNPFFIANIRLTGRNKLLVPPDILEDFKIVLPPMVSFHDSQGRSWPGKVYVWKDGRTMIGGWQDFCKSHHLGENDICICEFVLENGHHGDLIVVHIHHYNPEIRLEFNQKLKEKRQKK